MKLKTLVSSMAMLGLVSTAAIAAPTTNDNGVNSAFWMNIIDRNQDNAAGVVNLKSGQDKITGVIQTDLKYNDKRSTYANTSPNNKGSMGISLHNAELYYDNQFNDWANAHIALSYSTDFVTQRSRATDMFFPEAYVTLTHDHLFAKIGQQYLNFGSTMRNSLTVPVTAWLSNTNAVAATVGAVNIENGFYADASLYNGSNYGSNDVSTTTASEHDNANNIHGYTGELGYTQQNNGVTYNVLADYIGNLNDAVAAQYYIALYPQPPVPAPYSVPSKAIPGYAVHADVTKGSFKVIADYVAAITKNPDVTFNGNDSLPAAYNIEGDYNFMTMNYSSLVYLGYEGTQQLIGFAPPGSGFWFPKTRVLLGYGLHLSPNVSAKVEYAHDTDYSTSDSIDYTQAYGVLNGTGQSDNRVTARLTVTF